MLQIAHNVGFEIRGKESSNSIKELALKLEKIDSKVMPEIKKDKSVIKAIFGRDFNEDERFGCNSACDAAQSEDSWFDHREDDDCCGRTRELCEEERNFKRKLKCRIQVLDFALLETILFLDTHPCDFEALRYYRIIRKKLARLEKLYECKFGPLTNQGVDTEFGWEWATCPWPWEGKE